MMRILFMVCFLLAATMHSFGQQKAASSAPDTALSYSEAVSVGNVPKNDLFIRARDWLNLHAKNLTIQDKETGEVSGNSSIDGELSIRYLGTHSGMSTFEFNVTIWVKDGLYKYVITNIDNTKINGTSANGVFGRLYTSKHCSVKEIVLSQSRLDEAYQSLKDGFDKQERQLLVSLKSYMANETIPGGL